VHSRDAASSCCCFSMANRSCDSGHDCSSESKLQVVGESVLDTLNATGLSESLLQAVVKVGLITLVAIVPEHLSTICQGISVPSARASQYHLPGHLSTICQGISVSPAQYYLPGLTLWVSSCWGMCKRHVMKTCALQFLAMRSTLNCVHGSLWLQLSRSI